MTSHFATRESMGKAYKKGDAATPMLRQYLEIKDQYRDTILLFRLGDFYEMFFDDAVIASDILDITLTSRNKNDENPIPLCGVPYHSVEPYISKLLENGKKVAICEQTEDPKQAKGVVKRKVTKIYTPGVVPDGGALEAASNNFIAAVYGGGSSIGIAHADISTGIFRSTQLGSVDEALEELARIEPREILFPVSSDLIDQFQTKLRSLLPRVISTTIDQKHFDGSCLGDLKNADEFRSSLPSAARAAGAMYGYLKYTQRGEVPNIARVESYETSESMRLDESTKRNLELLRTIHHTAAYGSLFWLMNRTVTAMGARLLKQWLGYPLTSPDRIGRRLDAVEKLFEDCRLREELETSLKGIGDLERLNTRMTLGSGNARDMRSLATSLLGLGGVKERMAGCEGLLGDIGKEMDTIDDVAGSVVRSLLDELPLTVRDGGMIRDGVSSELDELRSIQRDGKQRIAQMERRERERTGISSLKLRYNKVFGYYIEITNTHREKVPHDYIRKQTLTSAERYITPELKEFEEKVLSAQDRIRELEYDIFYRLRSKMAGCSERIASTARAVAQLDVLSSLASLAKENRYSRPHIADDQVLDIEEGRHPVVEVLQRQERFVPNDIKVGGNEGRLIIITGPNMAGKSTVMRQTALIVLMAQLGSFVPAKRAHIGVVDRIFTRIGASDAISRGQSTFMVEMTEAAVILRESTEKSLVIIDEIGRGTSTFDGLAIAWSIAEDLHDRIMARTLFATHYHELTELAVTRPSAKNFQIAVREWNDQVIFLRKLVPGGTSHSYGIQVAKLAGLSQAVIERAHQILANMESGEFDEIGMPRIARQKNDEKLTGQQMALFTAHPVIDHLREADLTAITPIEALNLLHKWKQSI